MPLTLNKNLGLTLLGVWLVLTGLVGLLGLAFAGLGIILGIIALAAGAVILLAKS